MDQRTQLATGQINGRDTITVELIKADETPAVVIIRWPSKASVIHPHRFPIGPPPRRNCLLRLPPSSQRSRGIAGCEPVHSSSSTARCERRRH